MNKYKVTATMAMFGVCNPAAELTKFRKDGYSIKSRRVAMVKIIVRMNKYMVMKTPSQLPTKECLMMEYWIEK